ncbi:MAG: hypothetical protein ACR2PF_12090 [Rhizobiaceae bacterium]
MTAENTPTYVIEIHNHALVSIQKAVGLLDPKARATWLKAMLMLRQEHSNGVQL